MLVKPTTSDAWGTKWRESLFGVDLFMLVTSPVFYGVDLPRGDGSAVILIPGFMQSDAYLIVLYSWLARLGYKPFYSGVDRNAECPDLLIKTQLKGLIEAAVDETGRRVHLIGHSLGGIIARSLASQWPKLIASVITLGSPFRGAALQRSILRETEVVRRFIQQQHGVKVLPECYTERCPCDFMQSLHKIALKQVSLTSIYTREDGVLAWRSCMTGDKKIDVEVHGTHAGLAFNPEVYAVIAERLAKRAKPLSRRSSVRLARTL